MLVVYYESFGRDFKVKLDLSSYASKADLEGATLDTSNLPAKPDLARLKA